jgi:acetyl-CoA carboxylase biotin carboxyl carrier protein
MDLDHLKQILALVHEHELAELEIEQDGLRLWVRTSMPAPAAIPVAPMPAAPPQGSAAPPAPAPALAPAAQAPVAAGSDTEIELAIVKSPIVGTFYRSPEPGSASFVEVGSIVKKGQVLCIIEAMKLMNEIDSEYDGEVVNIYVENGQPVQYGERLFAMKTR